MNTTTSFVRLARWCGLAAGAFFVLGLLAAAEPAAKVVLDAARPLHVFVDIPGAIRPGAMSPWTDEDFSRVLGGYVRSEFKKRGYAGEIVVHQRWAELPKDGQRLEVRVTRWGADRLRGAECTLNAELTAADGRSSGSGVVSETKLEWNHNSYSTADALEDVARHSMRTLYQRFSVPTPKK
ncbi:MAG: hypothetical protein HY302_03775 [Opitutae bacterium]|nr:hypothetical protein [Opitutae bacterium]